MMTGATGDIDRGYAWVVCLCSFIAQAVGAGCLFVFGQFYLELSSTTFYDSRESLMAVVAVQCFVLYSACLLSGVLCSMFSVRSVSMVGVVVATVGYIIAAFSNHIAVLILGYGVFVGLGCSLTYMGFMTIIQVYFVKHRSLATGLAGTGLGFGVLCYAPAVRYFIANFGWRGAMLMLGGLFMQVMPLAALLRPPRIPKQKTIPEDPSELINSISSKTQLHNESFYGSNLSIALSHTESKPSVKRRTGSVLSHTSANYVKPRTLSVRSQDSAGSVTPTAKTVPANDSVYNSISSVCMAGSVNNVNGDISKIENEKTAGRGTLVDQPVDGNHDNDDNGHTDSSSSTVLSTLRTFLASTFDFRLLCGNIYVPLFFLASVLLAVNSGVPYNILPVKCLEDGLSKSEAALVIGLMGVADVVGRVTMGVLGIYVNVTLLLAISCALVGAATILLYWMHTFPTLVAFSMMWAFSDGGAFTLGVQSVVQYMGVTNFSRVFGFIMVGRAVGYGGGAPFGAYIMRTYGSASVVFFIVSFFPLTACLIMCLVLLLTALNILKTYDNKQEELEADI